MVEFPEATEQRRKEAVEREEREEREEKGNEGEGGGETTQQGSDTTNMDLGRIEVAVGATVGFRLPACCNVARVGSGAAEATIAARTRHVVGVKLEGYRPLSEGMSLPIDKVGVAYRPLRARPDNPHFARLQKPRLFWGVVLENGVRHITAGSCLVVENRSRVHVELCVKPRGGADGAAGAGGAGEAGVDGGADDGMERHVHVPPFQSYHVPLSLASPPSSTAVFARPIQRTRPASGESRDAGDARGSGNRGDVTSTTVLDAPYGEEGSTDSAFAAFTASWGWGEIRRRSESSDGAGGAGMGGGVGDEGGTVDDRDLAFASRAAVKRGRHTEARFECNAYSDDGGRSGSSGGGGASPRIDASRSAYLVTRGVLGQFPRIGQAFLRISAPLELENLLAKDIRVAFRRVPAQLRGVSEGGESKVGRVPSDGGRRATASQRPEADDGSIDEEGVAGGDFAVTVKPGESLALLGFDSPETMQYRLKMDGFWWCDWVDFKDTKKGKVQVRIRRQRQRPRQRQRQRQRQRKAERGRERQSTYPVVWWNVSCEVLRRALTPIFLPPLSPSRHASLSTTAIR